MSEESCTICGGDGRITNSFGGSSATCPACHGSGRRAEDRGFHDVTKTKPEHYRTGPAAGAGGARTRATWPTTALGINLATEVKESGLSEETKAKLIRQVIEYEASHGQCTKTFSRIIRKEVRAAPGKA